MCGLSVDLRRNIGEVEEGVARIDGTNVRQSDLDL
jgi:hypothetical protein